MERVVGFDVAKKAKEAVSLESFEKSMRGVYSTSVSKSTLGESPFVYKTPEAILTAIEPTVAVVEVIKPVIDIKA